MASRHSLECARRCRVCGRLLKAHPSPRSAGDFAEGLLVYFGIDLRLDEPGWAPTRLCSTCSRHISRSGTETKAGLPRVSTVEPIREWPRCSGQDCELCRRWMDESRRAGPHKKRKSPGRPLLKEEGLKGQEVSEAPLPGPPSGPIPKSTFGPVTSLVTSTSATASSEPARGSCDTWRSHPAMQTFATDDVEVAPGRFTSDLQGDFFLCPICMNVLDQAMEVPSPSGCQHPCCAGCWAQWLPIKSSCPVCRCRVTLADLQPVSRHLVKMLGNLELRCDFADRGCPASVKLYDLRNHVAHCRYVATPVLTGATSGADLPFAAVTCAPLVPVLTVSLEF